jgi:toxin ParE1/3/4
VAGIGAADGIPIAKGVLTLHVARSARRARHFIVLRVADEQECVLGVLRVLHDAMDAPRHIRSRAKK